MTNEYNPLEHSIVQALLKADATHRYEVPEYVEALIFGIYRELKRVYWNWNQERLEDREDWQLLDLPQGFEYRRYCWADCDCGAESPIHSKDCRCIVEHGEWNSRRLSYGTDEPENPVTEEDIAEAIKRGIPRQDFVISQAFRFARRLNLARCDEWEKLNPHPPCTCGAEATWKARDEHLPSCSPGLPNMSFGEVRINWYKYIGRGMSVNVDWDAQRWREWFDECLKRIAFYDRCSQSCHSEFRDLDAGRKPFSTDERVQCKDCKYCVQFGANSRIWNRQGSTDVKDAER